MGSILNRKLAAEALGCRGYILQSFRIVLAGFASPLNDDLVLDKSIYTGIRWYSNQQSGKIDRRQRQRSSGREETSEGGLLYSIVIGDSRGVNISKERMDMLKVRMDCGHGWLVPTYRCLLSSVY